MKTRWNYLLFVLALAGIGVILLLRGVSAGTAASVSGKVLNASGPVEGASVRVRATENATVTDANGEFTLESLSEGVEVEIAAWSAGYYIASAHVTPTVSGVTLMLRPYHTKDNPAYEWVDPTSGTSEGACGNCHPTIVSQWESNAHGGAVGNARFYSLYSGTNLSGTLQIGPGFVNDFPDTAGLCASCHAPGVGVDSYLTANMDAVREVITAGIHCDYCHKVGGVYLDPASDSVYPNVPGVESMRVLRPPEGDNIFFGPFNDIKDPDTYLPLISESQFCAPCHQFSFWGTPVYESYEEWLASPYAEAGTTCQSCHMPPNGDSYFALPEAGGLPHPPEKIPSHLQLGAASTELLQDTMTMMVAAAQIADRILVTVTLTNTGAGHHVPTDFPGRHMILTVSVIGEDELPRSLLDGPRVPGWGGAQAGLPGTAFAKVLRDVESGESPVVSYWKQALVVSDNRIPAMGSEASTYTFDTSPGEGSFRVAVRLIFRRVFAQVAQQKGWDMPDILMEEVSLVLP